MSTKLYLVRTHKIAITNIFTALLTKTVADTFYYPCDYALEGKFVVNQVGKFTRDFPHSNIRHIAWNDQTPAQYFDYLENSFTDATGRGQIVGIGCHDDSSVLYLSKKYSPYVVTAGVYYNQEHYRDLLAHTAEYHVYNLKNNQTKSSDHDLNLLQTLTTDDLIDYYSAAFDAQNIVPTSSKPVCDFNIAFHDLFDKNQIQDFFNGMNLPLTVEASNFYDSWLSQYSDR